MIFAGDVNRLDIKPITTQLCLEQLVKSATRRQNILDVFITNVPHLWSKVSTHKCLVRSDHEAVVIHPRTATRAIRRTVTFRDQRDHNKLAMARALENYNWDKVMLCDDPHKKVEILQDSLTTLFNTHFPCKTVRMSSRDPPFMSPLVKFMLNVRKKNIHQGNVNANGHLQQRINELIRENQVRAVNKEKQEHRKATKEWWSTVNSITGRKGSSTPISNFFDLKDINKHFTDINTDDNYIPPSPVAITENAPVPSVSVSTVLKFLLKVKRTSSGPDELPFWLWRDFAYDLAPVITSVFNCSLKHQTVPTPWKMANITPLPKVAAPKSLIQLRPISVTNVIIRLFERIIYSCELSHISTECINKDQFAYKKGVNSTMTLIKSQHMWHQWMDRKATAVRIFSFDFSKAFDSVSHNIVCEKLKTCHLNTYVYNWIISFLSDRVQRVKADGNVTNYLPINKGVPQGTILGPIIFSVMVNDIQTVQQSDNLLVKFADDLTLSIPYKEGYEDTTEAEVKNIIEWSEKNHMTLNLEKTWEMVLTGNSIPKVLPPPVSGIIQKDHLKLLGITFQSKLGNWDKHFNNMLSKASGRLYILRVCKSYGYTKDELHLLFNSLILSTFYFGIEVWGSACSKYLNKINKFFKRSYKFGYTKILYNIEDIIAQRDKSMFDNLTINLYNPLQDLLPERRKRLLRKRGHEFILPKVYTERFKNIFLNRCLFKFV